MKKTPVFWFTGLSGSGKTTVAEAVKKHLEKTGHRVLLLDGDEVRRRLHQDLGFSPEEIRENNKRITEICQENRDQYDVILVPIISPYADSRQQARQTLGEGFYEIYFNASLDCVISRDVKGLYAKAREKKIKNLIGFSPESPYEAPEKPDYAVQTNCENVSTSVKNFCSFVLGRLKEKI